MKKIKIFLSKLFIIIIIIITIIIIIIIIIIIQIVCELMIRSEVIYQSMAGSDNTK